MANASKGRWRLTLLLCGLSGLSCTLLMSAVLWIYGTPYNPQWWWIMGAILIASFILPGALVRPIEWVINGYRDDATD
jgi:hypothetical protein